MTRRFASKMTLFFIFAIIVLYILGKATPIEVLGSTLDTVAGLVSVILATFIFIQVKTLDKPVTIKRTLLELILFISGIIILVPMIYDFLKGKNNLLDTIIVAGYLLLLLLTAFFTKNEHVSSRSIRKSEKLFGTQSESRSSRTRNDFSNNPRFQKMMKR